MAHAAPLPDSKDPFYRYDRPLKDIPPGTVLRRRDITPMLPSLATPFKASQVLYRTTKTNGDPVVTVATVLKPLLAQGARILSYQTAYDDLGSTCTPSFTIQGGGDNSAVTILEQSFMVAHLAQGYTVVTSDYEGPTHDYTAGQAPAIRRSTASGLPSMSSG